MGREPHDHHVLSPVGLVGELLIEGPGLATGYLNDKEKTTAAFVSASRLGAAISCRHFTRLAISSAMPTTRLLFLWAAKMIKSSQWPATLISVKSRATCIPSCRHGKAQLWSSPVQARAEESPLTVIVAFFVVLATARN